MRSFNEFTAEKRLSESAILAEAEKMRKEFLQLEAQIMRGQGTSPNYHPSVNPRPGQLIMRRTGNKPVLYVIKDGSLFDGLTLTPLGLYFQAINSNPIPMKLANELNKPENKPMVKPEDLAGTQVFDYNLLTDYEKSLVQACKMNASTPIWCNDEKLIKSRQRDVDIAARKEADRLHGLGVVTHKDPTVSSAEEDLVRKRLLGGATTEPKETPEEMRRRVLGVSEPTATAPDDASRVRQQMGMQNIRDLMAQRQAARAAGEVVPLANRRRR
jgi:hypothetical protein